MRACEHQATTACRRASQCWSDKSFALLATKRPPISSPSMTSLVTRPSWPGTARQTSFSHITPQNIATAYEDQARPYIFSAPPAIHDQDIYHLFYVDQTTVPVERVDDTRNYRKNMLSFLRGEGCSGGTMD